jgi:nucleoside-diphosphate-sugar epimerase
MSSIGAIRSSQPPPYTFTENDWNNFAEKMCAEKGTETPGPVIYAASKVAAEKAFWEFKKKKNPGFAMASVNPVYVFPNTVIVYASNKSVSVW